MFYRTYSFGPVPPTILDDLPDQLDISHPTLAIRSITHPSLHNSAKRPSSPSGSSSLTYEELAHIGSGVITVSARIYDQYPDLQPLPCDILLGRICSITILAQVSLHLGLPRYLRADRCQAAHLRDLPHVQADLFMAHIGALSLSHPSLSSNELTSYLGAIFDPVLVWAFGTLLFSRQDLDGDWSMIDRDDLSSTTPSTPVAYLRGTLDLPLYKAVHEAHVIWPIDEFDAPPPYTPACAVYAGSGDMIMPSTTRSRRRRALAATAWELGNQELGT